jgi:prepilin-type N-terminal cleavage/methylation domain-containing protein
MKRNLRAAFTLIELLVVITIIAILASFALPAYTTVQERAQQTKDLSNAKQVGLALKQFASDNNGSFPNRAPGADYSTAAVLTSGNVSNDAFWWLFPNYLQSEDIFVVPGSVWTPNNADNVLDTTASATRSETLEGSTGGGGGASNPECGYAYVAGLTDTSNPAFPLVADAFSTGTPLSYETSKSVRGGVWAGRKAIVLFADASGQILKCTLGAGGTTSTVVRPGGNGNLFSPNAGWLDGTANFVINPQQ